MRRRLNQLSTRVRSELSLFAEIVGDALAPSGRLRGRYLGPLFSQLLISVFYWPLRFSQLRFWGGQDSRRRKWFPWLVMPFVGVGLSVASHELGYSEGEIKLLGVVVLMLLVPPLLFVHFGPIGPLDGEEPEPTVTPTP